MDIIEFSKQIYKDEPQGPRAIGLELDTITSNVNECFEVVSLFLLEGIKIKILDNPKLQRDNLNVQRFIQEQTELLKQYCQSINIDFTITSINKKDSF